MRVSFLLPCHNAAATLSDAITSLEQQSCPDFEVIAVDDGSSDDTLGILEQWRARDARVHVHSQLHAGIVAALTKAAQHATGDIIARMDADDIAHPRRLERQLALFDADRHLAACGTGVRYFPRAIVRAGALAYEQWLNGIVSSDDVAREVFVECPIAHPTMCIRRSVFEQVGGYQDRGWPEDYDLVLRLYASGARLANVPEVLLDWRERVERASRTDPRYDATAFRRCKVSYLRRTLLCGRNGVVVWGAGPVGKAFARELIAQGEQVRAFIDIDPRKIGQTVHGARVVMPAQIDEYRDSLVVAAVGNATARFEIRAAVRDAGLVEGTDFIAVA
jgi:glycosyltransferase involved in cell wall biosynthesis